MSEWEEITFGDAPLQIIDGDRGKNYPKQNDFHGSGYCLFLNAKNVTLSGFVFSDLNFITKGRDELLRKGKLKRGDVVLTTRGTVGNVAYYDDSVPFDHVRINSGMVIVRSEGMDEIYCYYLLKSLGKIIRIYTTGSAQPQLPIRDLVKIPILLPPFSEQKAIVAVLSSLDDKIDLLQRQNQTLEALAQTFFRQWFVEEEGDDWKEGTLGDVIEIFDRKRVPLSKMEREKMKDGKLYPYYGAASIMDYVNDYIFDGEYILLGEDGTVRTNEGFPILQYATCKFWVNNHAHIFQARKPYSNFFIWCYLKQKNISNIVTGAVQPKINQTNLKALDFPIAPAGLVSRFINTTDPIHKKIKANLKQITTLEDLRDVLLPNLMNGEVRVCE